MSTYLIALESMDLEAADPDFVGTYRTAYARAIERLCKQWEFNLPEEYNLKREWGPCIHKRYVQALDEDSPAEVEDFKAYVKGILKRSVSIKDWDYDDYAEVRALIRDFAKADDHLLIR